MPASGHHAASRGFCSIVETLALADDHPPPASPLGKETRRSGFFEMKSRSHRCSKQNGHLIDHRRSTQGNRFATDDRGASKETAGLIYSPQGEHRRPLLKRIDGRSSLPASHTAVRCVGLLRGPTGGCDLCGGDPSNRRNRTGAVAVSRTPSTRRGDYECLVCTVNRIGLVRTSAKGQPLALARVSQSGVARRDVRLNCRENSIWRPGSSDAGLEKR